MFKESLDLQCNCTSQFRISMPYCKEISQSEWQNHVVCDYPASINSGVRMPQYFCMKRCIYLKHINSGGCKKRHKNIYIGISKGNFKEKIAQVLLEKCCYFSSAVSINKCYFKASIPIFKDETLLCSSNHT